MVVKETLLLLGAGYQVTITQLHNAEGVQERMGTTTLG